METTSIAAATIQAPENATEDVFQPPQSQLQPSQSQLQPHEVDSSVVTGSTDDSVCVSGIPSLSPTDDDFDHERNSGENRDQDQVDNPVATDVIVSIDDLKQKIIRQVEYYFSDENLPTDKFLLNAMKRNKKGFVPISTIATFHKMKKLTPDQALIVSALKESSFLVVSPDGKKVKRLNPLPEVRNPKIFTVLVENLPEDHSDENMQEIFGKAGSIKSVSICDPNAAEESEKGCKKDKFIRTRLHAFVEYETVEAAEKAAATLNNEQDWRNGLRVKLLEQEGKYSQRRPSRREVDKEKDNTGRGHKANNTGRGHRENDNTGRDHKEENTGQGHREKDHLGRDHKEDNTGRGHREKDNTGRGHREKDNTGRVHDQTGGGENKKAREHQRHRNHHSDNPADDDGNHQKDKNGNKGRGQGRGRRQYHQGGNGIGHGTSPSASSSFHQYHHFAEVSKPPPGPRMPDGTRGFTMGRGKPLPPSTSAQNSHEV